MNDYKKVQQVKEAARRYAELNHPIDLIQQAYMDGYNSRNYEVQILLLLIEELEDRYDERN